MIRHWTPIENELVENVVDQYRLEIAGKSRKSVNEITRRYAENLLRDHPKLEGRSINAIHEHLSYYDDLLAGIGHLTDYAKKDAHKYGTRRRPDGNREWNKATRRGYRERVNRVDNPQNP